ncbi:hypothetical protein CLIB1444_04S06524 [[Candida] jaroonii]|uniref:Uncharacterized protein n=1 Tax=[Candida] jaroonii TaxID=467808 RepID=A0ACA9Y754_9ASCO|nr:hypothetical protein CLIB1444_04S06524 [[Candida] jaroonii]
MKKVFSSLEGPLRPRRVGRPSGQRPVNSLGDLTIIYDKPRQSVVRDIFGKHLDISGNDLNICDKTVSLVSYNKNGKTVICSESTTLCICTNDKFVVLKHKNELMDNFIIHKHQISVIKSNLFFDKFLIVLTDGRYISLSLQQTERSFYKSLVLRKFTKEDIVKDLEEAIKDIDDKGMDKYRTRAIEIEEKNKELHGLSEDISMLGIRPGELASDTFDLESSSSSSDGFKPPPASASKMYRSSTRTRSSEIQDFVQLNRPVRTRSSVEKSPIILEKPASFDPPLNYSFNGKPFTLAYNDFKTLYNNDWVNDIIIDFFINYEIEKSIDRGNMRRDEVYAFNSFFFNKLMSKTTEEVNYYDNVKRWLSKVDLFSYSSVIIPINEASHWYGCIIVGLPEFLKAQKERSSRVDENLGGGSSNIPQNIPHEILHDEHETSYSEEPNADTVDLSVGGVEDSDSETDNEKLPDEDVTLKYPTKINVFVFDSLNIKHLSLNKPIKSFLIEYCKEKHDLDIFSKDIVFRSTKVPKQNNFNDCGIHVIYNIRKFLNDRSTCLRIWDRNKSNYKHFFLATERIKVRKELIDILLDLHAKQPKIHAENDLSDEEIELVDFKKITPAITISRDNGRGRTPKKKLEITIDTSRLRSSESVDTNNSDVSKTPSLQTANLENPSLEHPSLEHPGLEPPQIPGVQKSIVNDLIDGIDTVDNDKRIRPHGDTTVTEEDIEFEETEKKIKLLKGQSWPELKNKNLQVLELRSKMSKTSCVILNDLFDSDTTFTDQEIEKIISFNNKIKDLSIYNASQLPQVARAVMQFKKTYKTEVRPRDMEFKIIHPPPNHIIHTIDDEPNEVTPISSNRDSKRRKLI